jgi:hypothetical protein
MTKKIKTLILSVSLLVFSLNVFAENESGHTHIGKTCMPDCPMYGQLAAPTPPDNDDGESVFDRLIFEIGKIFVF